MFHRGDDVPFYGALDGRPVHGHYRTKDEVEEHRKRDPLLLLKDTMLHKAALQGSNFKQDRAGGDKDVITDAVKFADESPFPIHRLCIPT